jgi:hypothetical protein
VKAGRGPSGAAAGHRGQGPWGLGGGTCVTEDNAWPRGDMLRKRKGPGMRSVKNTLIFSGQP